ncbi:MAG TPA: efflux RND transporter periplasmic adaptor subunit [Candidatus Wunengus sp. YC63]|uniref:efflux RND transporter periplasmic adaptor subunit n=1 Tax=unclassified Candidatus Wunengus TaxID=3367695 RepID=UPI0027132098|nr:efflux RND transporter periplasmic adaptor subunit [Candidatus Brocadiales bacterium]
MSFNQMFLYKKCLKKPVLIILSILFSIYGFYSLVTHYNASLRHALSLIPSASAEEAKEKKVLYWTCPMHPSVKMDKSGKCPICGMPLVPVYENGTEIKEEGTVTAKAKEELKEAKEVKEKKILYWTCGMHPSVKMDKPGKCPICAMDLIPVYEKGAGAEEGAMSTIELSEHARSLAQVKTDVVSFKTLTKDIYTVGQIEYDERLKSIVSAWIPGRIDKLFIDFTGTEVIKGESMVWLYSPELVSTQEEYLLALETLDKVKESPFDEVINGAKSLIEASKRRLLWWGITEKQIEELTKNKKIKQHTVIYAPLSGIVIEKKALEGQYVMQGEMIYTVADLSNIWMKANIYEYEMAWIKIGQEVEVTTPTYPGEAFIGRVSFIEPFLDEKTRSIKIRCDIPNHQLKLKPSMYVNTRIRIPVEELEKQGEIYASGLDYICPNHPEIKSSRPGMCPEDNIPFVKKPPTQTDLVATVDVPLQQGAIEFEYVCPMKCHTSKEPGNCPVCGMKLEKKEIPVEDSGEKLTCICPQEWDPKTAPKSCPMCGMLLKKNITITTLTDKKKHKFVYMCPMACMTSDKPGECPECKRQMGRWEVKEDAGIKVKKIDSKKRSIYACPMHPEVTSDKPGNCTKCGMLLEKTTQVLAIPATAVLDTGIRKIVYLDKGNGQYVGKEVTLGPKAGDYYPVLEGLEEGNKVVTSANFLIDSQSQLTGGASALYGGAMEFKEEKK